ncbi:Nlrc5, partial [Symbiodinium sp. CCMP2456]
YLLLMENIPQGICAMIFLRYEGGSLVVTVLSLAIPAVQIGLTLLLYSRVRAEVAPYFGRRLRALVSAGDQLMAQRLWREADFEFDKELFKQALPFMRSKEIGAERYDDIIQLWKERWSFSNLGLMEEQPSLEAFCDGFADAQWQWLAMDLSHNKLRDAGAKTLATAVSSLKQIQDMSLNLEMSDLGMEGAGALASAIGILENMQKLSVNLKSNKLGDVGARALATAVSKLKKMEDLSVNVEMSDLGEEGALSLLEALRATRPAASQLELGGCAIGKGAVALARALRSGEVSCRVTHPVVEMLLREGFKDEEAGKLELGLSSKEDLGPLCQALPLLRLREVELGLADLELGEEGALSLLEALRATRPAATQLDLGDCDIGKGAVALARAEVRGHVAHPVVEFLVKLEDDEFKELEEERRLELDLTGPGLGSRHGVGLALGSRLNLYGSDERWFRRLFEPLCRALQAQLLPQLRELLLGLGDLGDAFGDDQARALAPGLQQQKELQRLVLDLYRTSLGDAGATAVVESVRQLPQLTKLTVDLENNKLSEKEQKKLRAAFHALPVAEKRIRL